MLLKLCFKVLKIDFIVYLHTKQTLIPFIITIYKGFDMKLLIGLFIAASLLNANTIITQEFDEGFNSHDELSYFNEEQSSEMLKDFEGHHVVLKTKQSEQNIQFVNEKIEETRDQVDQIISYKNQSQLLN